MDEFPSYLCLTDLLDQDLSSYDGVGTLEELQARAEHLRSAESPASNI